MIPTILNKDRSLRLDQEGFKAIIETLILFCIFLLSAQSLFAQPDEKSSSDRPVRNIFESVLLFDNQTVEVPIKGTLEFDIMHRFGTIHKGFEDLYGFYSNSNIRMGISYSPVNNLFVGVGLTKFKHIVDFNAKYALLKQTRSGSLPISVTYYGNLAMDARPEENRELIYNTSDRYSYFHQVLIGRKFNDWFSFQIAPSVSHYNIVDPDRKNDHYAVAFGTQIGLTESMDLIFNVDQPLTKHIRNNPNPNVSLGIQIGTSSHAFQFFIGNFNAIVPQENNYYNIRNYSEKFTENFLIGFNITRLWSY